MDRDRGKEEIVTTNVFRFWDSLFHTLQTIACLYRGV